MPEKPSVDLCTLDIPASEGICAHTLTQEPPRREPIANLDKATAFTPEEWVKVKNYIDELELYAKDLERKCK